MRHLVQFLRGKTRDIRGGPKPALWLAALWLLWPGTFAAIAFTAAEAETMFTAYNKAFYFSEGTNGYYRATTKGGKTFFWDRAEQMEMVLDVYERTSNSACLALFSNLYNGFVTDHGRDWSHNQFNDDIMWMVIACARGRQDTGNPVFGDAARENFDRCFARGWSSALGGGLWWTTTNQSKNACVNGPAAIAAHLLHEIYGDPAYLEKSERVYQWERQHLFDTNTGAVADAMDAGGKLHSWTSTYNQGTFLGAATRLGHAGDARLALDYTQRELCEDGLFQRYRLRGDAGGFNGIFARWAGQFVKKQAPENRYLPWLEKNADAAWAARRAGDNLCWSRWPRPTPDLELPSWSCSSAVVIMHAVPPAARTGQGIETPP